MNAKRKSKFHIVLGKIGMGFLWFFTVLATLLAFTLAALLGCDLACESSAYVPPKYAQIDITPILNKEEWTDEDYRTLYYQTGLNASSLLSLKGAPRYILQFQYSMFVEPQIVHETVAPTTPHDMLNNHIVPVAPLQKGDIFVTSSCHTFGWRNGHAALVVNAQNEELLQSFAPGHYSATHSPYWFSISSNFMILRLKDASHAERAAIADYAVENLTNIPYSLTVGLFSSKDQTGNVTQTNCSHLVWQAYKALGYDLDSDGGPICTTRDIANSPLLEVVQVYGFDLDTLWS